MKDCDQMAKLVLNRIQAERPPKWKLILSADIKRLILAILVILIVATLTFIAIKLQPCGVPEWLIETP